MENMVNTRKVDRFAEWMLKINSIHYANNEAMSAAYAKIIESENIINLKNK